MSDPAAAPIPTPADTATLSPGRWPLLGIASFLVAPGMLALGYALAYASPDAGRWLVSNAGISLTVLGASLLAAIASVGARVRRERFPWLGIVGAVFSSLPLLLFLLGMLLKL